MASDRLALVLVFAGLAVLGSAWYRSRTAPEQPVTERPIRQPFDAGLLLSRKGFTFEGGPPDLPNEGLLALFVLHRKVCPPCLNEVAEYAELLEEFEARGVEVQPVALVVEKDSLQALRFLKVSNLPMPAGVGEPWALAALLGKPGEEMVFLQQLVFVRRPEEILFYQVLLSNTTTEVDAKRQVLERMMAAQAQTRSAVAR